MENRILQAWKRVLENDSLSPRSNFFEVGGDSVSALRVIDLLAEDGLSISPRDFYLAATAAGQAERVTERVDGARGGPGGREPGPHGPVRLPLTPLQAVMVVEGLRRPDSDAYWLVLAYALPPRTTPEEARAAWRETVRANSALRTRIGVDGSGPFQLIGPHGPALEIVTDGVPGPGPALAEWCRERSRKLRGRFPDELLRAHFLQGGTSDDGARDTVLVLVGHHALMDGWSMEQCVGDFHRRLARPDEPLAERPSSADYLSWIASPGPAGAAREFWREQMSGAGAAPDPSFARLPGDREPGGQPGQRSWERALSTGAVRGLDGFSRRHRLTRASVFTTLWMHLLRQYQDGPDVSVGLTVNTRPVSVLPGAGEASGFLINTLPLRLSLSDDFTTDCARVLERTVAVTEHAHLPYAEVVAAAGLPGMSRLFTSTLVFQNFRREEGLPGAPVRPLFASGASGDELSLTVDLGEDRVTVEVAWDTERYDRSSVTALVRDLEYWLARLDEVDPAAGLVTPSDASHAFSGTTTAPAAWCVGDLLAAGDPDLPALVHGTRVLTRRELRHRIEELAEWLATTRGVGPGDRVILEGERGVEGVVALCAVWSLGASWCPTSPSWTAERRAGVAAALAPRTVVALSSLPEPSDPGRTTGTAPLGRLPGRTLAPGSPAYHVATSGSTGTPRLVGLPAGGLRPVVEAWRSFYALSDGQRVLQFGSWTSDVFVGDVLKALATGGTLVICPDEDRIDLVRTGELIHRWRITLLESTPAVVSRLVRHLAATTPPADLSTLIVGADTFRLHEMRETVTRLWEGVTLYNGYGLSEGTIESLVQECHPGLSSRSGLCPIGHPLPGTAVSVVDREGRPLPYGAVGELVLTGPQVGLGYRTVNGHEDGDRFETVGGTRRLRTGDLVRFGEAGALEFHGRRDGLAKVRGHRVELGEVEDRLLRLPGVEEAFALLAERAWGAELVAFVGGAGIDERTVRDGLRGLLPEHAVPGHVIVEAALPRGESGKLDRVLMRRRAARAHPVSPSGAEPPATASGDELTARVTRVWEEVLERPVHPDRSFFDQGGNSLLAMVLHARMRETLPRHEFSVGHLFAHPTITTFRASLDAPVTPDRRPPVPTDELGLLRALERGELDVPSALRALDGRPGNGR
ncbi:AMP-binding protein [Streptomyces sp. JNUCC 64]